jgi:hypothetical protein
VPDVPQFILDRARAKQPIFAADEVATWPNGLLDQLVESGVLAATDNASAVRCDACGHDHVERVEYIRSPPGTDLRAYISCPESNGRVRVPLERLRQWVVNQENLPMQTTTATLSPSSLPPAPSGAVPLPHALSVAYAGLTAVLDDAIEMYRQNMRFPNPTPVMDAIERFVHELRLVPPWFEELRRRVTLVEVTCRNESAYAIARAAALESHTAEPQQISPGKFGLDRVRHSLSDGPTYLAEIIDLRKSIEAVLDEPSLGLSPQATRAFSEWRDICRRVQQEAERLVVDGCWYLYHVYNAAEDSNDERSQLALAVLSSNMGGVHLDDVRDAAHSIVAWVQEQGSTDATPENTSAEGERKPGRRRRIDPAKRSWTQPKLDEAINEYWADRSSNYRNLVDGVKRRKQGAMRDARRLFGRNAIVRALGVRSPAMVTNSSAWQKIADELGLRGEPDSNYPPPGGRVGIEIALETQAVESCESGLDRAVKRETIAFIKKKMPPNEADATIEKLQRGEITDDQARQLVDLYADQQSDEKTHRVRPAK